MSQIVTCYGLHETDEGVWYLHQGRNNAMNFISMKQASPFEVMNLGGKKVACPHLINGSVPMPDRVQWDLFMELYQDPLLKYFLPIPRKLTDPIPYVNDPNNELIMLMVLLSRLSSPIYPVVHQYDSISMSRIQEELRITNVSPLVVMGLQTCDQVQIEQLAREARRAPRTLILVGDPMVVVCEPLLRVPTFLQDFEEVKLHTAPMETLGAVALRRFCRGEQVDASWVKRESVENEAY